MSEARILAWNTGIQITGKAISTAIGVIVIGLMARYLGQDGFGIYTTANSFLQVFALILDLGINVMLVQMLGERAGDKEFEKRATSAVFTFRLVTALILLTLAPIIGLFLDYPWELKLAFFAIWGSYFSSVVNQIVIGTEQRHFKMHYAALGEVVGRLVTLAGLLIGISSGLGVVGLTLIVSIGSTANFVLNLLLARRHASFAWNWDPAFWRTLLGRSWPIGLSILFNLIYFRADTLILSYVRPLNEVGIYGAAYRVLEILITLPFMYCGVLLPLIARAWADKDKERFNRLYRNALSTMALLAAPMVAGVFVMGDRIMLAIAGDAFVESGMILKILILAAAVIFLGTVSSHAIVALDAQKKSMPLYIAIAIVTLIGYIIFIPRYGMYAAAWLTVFSEGAVAIGTTIISFYIAKSGFATIAIAKASACAAAMALAILPLQDMWLPIPIAAGAIIYGLLVVVTGTISRQTMKDILSFRRGTPSTGMDV
ncbi:MAG: flippase [Patescibacteria group bacterium]|nr:flippase [Patescibacteria group bacterium]